MTEQSQSIPRSGVSRSRSTRSMPQLNGESRPQRRRFGGPVQALGLDRTRLAAALDGETARSRRLETTIAKLPSGSIPRSHQFSLCWI